MRFGVVITEGSSLPCTRIAPDRANPECLIIKPTFAVCHSSCCFPFSSRLVAPTPVPFGLTLGVVPPLPPCLPRVVPKHSPSAVPCVAGITPAAPNASHSLYEKLRVDCVARPHWPRAVAPRPRLMDSGWNRSRSCTARAPAVISLSPSLLPLCSPSPLSFVFVPITPHVLVYPLLSCH